MHITLIFIRVLGIERMRWLRRVGTCALLCNCEVYLSVDMFVQCISCMFNSNPSCCGCLGVTAQVDPCLTEKTTPNPDLTKQKLYTQETEKVDLEDRSHREMRVVKER